MRSSFFISLFLLFRFVSSGAEGQGFERAVCQAAERQGFEQAVRQAVERQMQRYPKSTLKDLYKNFFQDKYGPGHLIGDTAAAGAYLRQELASYHVGPSKTVSAARATPREAVPAGAMSGEAVAAASAAAGKAAPGEISLSEIAEPTGWEGNFLRVDLSVIQTGQIPYAVFFDAFQRSINGIAAPPVAEWQKEWNQIEAIIRSMHLSLPGYEADREEIQDRLERGEYVGHHSTIFENTYAPHYRIVRKDIFEKELKPLLSR